MSEWTRLQALDFRDNLQVEPRAACLLKCPDRVALVNALYAEIDRLNHTVTQMEAGALEDDNRIYQLMTDLESRTAELGLLRGRESYVRNLTDQMLGDTQTLPTGEETNTGDTTK